MPETNQDSQVPNLWWERTDLGYLEGQLWFEGIEVRNLVDCNGTPLYVYNRNRAADNISRLSRAMSAAHPRTCIFYAMKSNRYEPLLKWMASLGSLGIDACSPGEVELALQCGFRDEQISYTATGMSYREWELVLRHPGIVVNADSFGDIRKIAEIAPGRTIGIRVNPGISLGYRQNPKLMYTQQSRFSKFGVSMEECEQAIAFAETSGLQVCGIHAHVGCGYLAEQLPQYERLLDRLVELISRFPKVESLNLGGGFGIPLVEEDGHWDLEQWAALLHSRFRGWEGQLCCEPGDYLVKDAGLLLAEVTNIETKCGRKVIWVNAGFNIHPEPVFYSLPLYPVPLVQRPGETETVTIVGNINEVHDIWMEDIRMLPVKEGDVIAFLNAGGYGAAMSSNHCCRGTFREMLIPTE